MTAVVSLLIAAVCLALVVVATVILGLRFQSRVIRRLVSRLNRRVINPRNLLTAGTADSPWAVIRHRGRVTGREFSTPVGALEALGGFVVALPYGPESDWVRNIQASGALLAHQGAEYRLDDIAIVPLSSTPLAKTDRFSMRLFGVRWAVLMKSGAPGLLPTPL